MREIELVDRVVPPGAEGAAVALAAVSFEDGGVERYALPVRLDGGGARECTADDPLWPALARLSRSLGERSRMFARVSTYDVPPERVSDAVQPFREAIASIGGMPGLLDAYLLVSDDGKSALTVTLWETHDTMAASRVRATRVRSDAAAQVGGGVRSTVEYRVAVHEAHSSS